MIETITQVLWIFREHSYIQAMLVILASLLTARVADWLLTRVLTRLTRKFCKIVM